MYGVMRERARNRTMQAAGLAVSAAITVGAATLFMNSLGQFVGAFAPPPPTTLTTITPDEETPPPPTEFVRPDDEVKLPTTDVVLPPLPDFPVTEERKEDTITVVEGDIKRIGDPEAAIAPAKIVRIAPKLRSVDKPPYPASELRAKNEGNTSLGLCVDARGRVTSASLTKSSGHSKLDEAALRWVKDARFSPGTVDGAAQAVCGHTVVYEWRLEDAR